ncbi:MAG TPA: molybdopterin-dependent oxidoreductase, partial [Bryobacteraceae bacterium]|nr:molybdopterin-dependent oxidoreductase [Bryobacteraceae bacterium]
ELSRSQISKPFPNEMAPPTAEYKRLQAGGFVDWRLTVNGMVERPGAFSLAELRSFPSRSQITAIQCEEGWSYIAEWIGVPLFHVLSVAGVRPEAKYVVYDSMEPNSMDSIDMDDAMHPQTLLAYGMNGGDLPTAHGGPLRMRLPKQLGYKNVKFITKLIVTDDLKRFGKGFGSDAAEAGYAWYVGI